MLEEITYGLRQRLWGRLQLRHDLPRVAAGMDSPEIRFYLSLIDAAGGGSPDPELVVDVGCRNWSYAPALARAFPRARLLGVEADGGRRYWNLHRRIDVARAHALALESKQTRASVRGVDFRKLPLSELTSETHSVMFCFFFPFVSLRPCRRWGLPPRFADYGALLAHAFSLKIPTRLIATHQGEWEAELARRLYEERGLAVRERVLTKRDFGELWPGEHDVHVFSV
jgi:hypothetical protein